MSTTDVALTAHLDPPVPRRRGRVLAAADAKLRATASGSPTPRCRSSRGSRSIRATCAAPGSSRRRIPTESSAPGRSRQAQSLGRAAHPLGERRRDRDHGRQRHAHLQRASRIRAAGRALPAQSMGRPRRFRRGSPSAAGSAARGTGTSPMMWLLVANGLLYLGFLVLARRVARHRPPSRRCARRLGDDQVLSLRAEGPSAPGQAQRAAEERVLRHARARHHHRAERARHLEAGHARLHHAAVRELQVGALRPLRRDGAAPRCSRSSTSSWSSPSIRTRCARSSRAGTTARVRPKRATRGRSITSSARRARPRHRARCRRHERRPPALPHHLRRVAVAARCSRRATRIPKSAQKLLALAERGNRARRGGLCSATRR